jgi:hypothetical protein
MLELSGRSALQRFPTSSSLTTANPTLSSSSASAYHTPIPESAPAYVL